MLGTIIGDIIGSIYEANNIKRKEFRMFNQNSRFTDDSVMTSAIANACLNYLEKKDIEEFRKEVIYQMKFLGLTHINAGYGRTFLEDWLLCKNPQPYNSYGNGSAMRVSPIAYIASSLEEAQLLAEISASVSHNHPEGIKGAQAITSTVFLARQGKNKEEIRKYVEEQYYKLDFTLESIRKDYKFDVSCQGSVPQAIVAFLEAENYEDAVRNAISIGGDSDTIAAMTGSIAEAYYGIPETIKNMALTYLDEPLLNSVENFYKRINKKQNFEK